MSDNVEERVAPLVARAVPAVEPWTARMHKQKFQGIENLEMAALLFENADKVAERVSVGRPALDLLYKHSRWKSPSRAAWERDIRTSVAIDLLIRMFFLNEPLGIFGHLIDQEAMKAAFEKLQSPKGTLVLTFHGGFPLLVRKIFTDTPDQAKSFGRGGSITVCDLRAGLFAALRDLQAGRQLMMAPDGPDGRQSGTLSILGKTVTCGDGAAYLAHAAGCETAWYCIARKDNRFVPVVEPGPSKTAGESIEQFTHRLHTFYASKIEEVLTGDPCSIGLRPVWARVLGDRPPR